MIRDEDFLCYDDIDLWIVYIDKCFLLNGFFFLFYVSFNFYCRVTLTIYVFLDGNAPAFPALVYVHNSDMMMISR